MLNSFNTQLPESSTKAFATPCPLTPSGRRQARDSTVLAWRHVR